MPDAGQAAAPAATDIVQSIQAKLNLEQPTEPQATAPATPAEGEPQPVQEPEATPEAPKVEGEDAPKEDAPVATEIPLDQLEAIALEVTVKGEDGKDVVEKPTVKELREGYMRQKDYSRKTAEVARQREEVGNQVRQAVDGERSQYAKQLQELQNVLLETVAPDLKDVNWNDLAKNDPFKYVELRNRADQITSTLSKIQQQQTELTAKQQTEQKEANLKVAAKTLEKLSAEIPGWSPTLYQSLLKSGEAVGYKHEEVANWIDDRAIRLLHKAYLYDQLKSDKPAADKKVVVAPKVVKPGAASTATQAQSRYGEAMKRLGNSGRIEDAADAIRAKLGL
jgi:hypothetical protein